jgi:hypothetical protein
MNLYICYPPHPIETSDFSIFLAGTIDMGYSRNWQQEVITYLDRQAINKKLTIFNPRRKDWDNSWVQDMDNPAFNQQVNWELDALEAADLIILYLEKDSKSPISLLELGLFADTEKVVVCCEKGFWRKGNVDIVCQRKGITIFENIEDMLLFISTQKLFE